MREELDHIVTLRLPSKLMNALREYAGRHDQTISELMREQVRRLVLQPIGWHCEHVSMGSAEGALRSVECGAGCDMRREYAS